MTENSKILSAFKKAFKTVNAQNINLMEQIVVVLGPASVFRFVNYFHSMNIVEPGPGTPV